MRDGTRVTPSSSLRPSRPAASSAPPTATRGRPAVERAHIHHQPARQAVLDEVRHRDAGQRRMMGGREAGDAAADHRDVEARSRQFDRSLLFDHEAAALCLASASSAVQSAGRRTSRVMHAGGKPQEGQ